LKKTKQNARDLDPTHEQLFLCVPMTNPEPGPESRTLLTRDFARLTNAACCRCRRCEASRTEVRSEKASEASSAAASPPPRHTSSPPPRQHLLATSSPPPRRLLAASSPPPRRLLAASSPPPPRHSSPPPRRLLAASSPPPRRLFAASSPPPRDLPRRAACAQGRTPATSAACMRAPLPAPCMEAHAQGSFDCFRRREAICTTVHVVASLVSCVYPVVLSSVGKV
jgi:hypothetical protein